MGCDIHLWAEIRQEQGWEKVGYLFDHPYYRPDEKTTVCEDGYVWNADKTDQPYSGRNYDLFSILANVRNGEGFAGVDTGDGFNVIANPRGVPEDASKEYRRQVEDWGLDGHSHSWLLLSEVLAFDWQQTTTHRGWLQADEWSQFKKDGCPNSWCGDAWGPSVRKVTNAEMDELIAKGDTQGVYTQAEWSVEYYQTVGQSWWDAMEKLKALDQPENIRLVFFFDN